MTRYLNPSIWDDLSRDIYGATGRVILEIFLAGGKSGMKLLPERIAVLQDWGIFSQAAQEYLKLYRLNTVANLTNTTRDKAIGIINDWIQSGDPLDMLVTRLEPWLGATRAERIAVTEVTRTYASGNIAAWKSTGLVGGKKWATARDELVCPICGPLDGQLVDIDGEFQLENIPEGLAKSGEDFIYFAPPAHVNCILPGNEVISPGPISAMAKSFYVGGCVEITLTDGRNITVTQNHPVLTTRGWIAAQFLTESDNVISAALSERELYAINPYDNNRPAMIEEIFGSFVKSKFVLSESMPASAEDLHGDGRGVDGNIQVVFKNRLLLGEEYARIAELTGDPVLSITTDQKTLLDNSLSAKFIDAHFPAPDGVVRGGNLGDPFFGSHATPFDKFGFSLGAKRNASLDHVVMESAPTDTDLVADFVLRFSRHITFDQIREVRNFEYSGHVYDLQSDMYSLYTCNSIIVKNCRCYLQPFVSEELLGKRLERELGLD